MRSSIRVASFALLALVLVVGVGWDATVPQRSDAASPDPSTVTRPFILDHNRIIVEVELQTRSGGAAQGRAWVDTGTDALIIAESMARSLGLDTSALRDHSGSRSVEVDTPAPMVRFGKVALDTTGVPLWIHPGESTQAGLKAEVHLPAAVFRSHHVVFDYPARRLTVGPSGQPSSRGTPVKCRINPRTGLFMVDATIDGDTVALGVDTGSAGTWVSRELTELWHEHRPDLRVAIGAAGSTNFFGGRFEIDGSLMRLPKMDIGGVATRDVALLGLSQGLFDWYSRKSADTVNGFIGGNVLRRVRLEVDWPASMTYWEPHTDVVDRDLDIVGLTLRPEQDGTFWVVGVVRRGERACVEGIRAGDRLMRVGELEVTGETMGNVVNALRGEPGTRRELVVDREGRHIVVDALVQRLP